MCTLCAANPVNFLDGTHAQIGGFLGDASDLPPEALQTDIEEDISEIKVDGTINASLLEDGSELLRLDASEGDVVSLDLGAMGAELDGDVTFSIYDADGTLIAQSDSGDQELSITATDDGPVFVLVSEGRDAIASGGSGGSASAGSAAPVGTLDTMADFLTDGYWSQSFKFNLGDTGYLAKNGALTFNLSGHSGDSNGLTADRKELVREAFKVYEEVLGIDFQETSSGGADFRFGDNQSGAYASTSYAIVGGQGYVDYSVINIQQSWYGSSSELDEYTYQTALHEIGHALGLGHQGDYNGSADYGRDAEFSNDSWQATMMSYFSQTGNSTVDASYAFLLSPMAVDWIALDNLYGEYGFSSANAFDGDTVYGFNTNISSSVSSAWANLSTYAATTAFTIVDGGGIDTVDFSGYSQNQRIDLTVTEGSFTQATTSDIGTETGNMTLAVGTVIENAIGGTANDKIIGNDAANTLDGGAGDDTLTGGAGDDTLTGGAGDDELIGGTGTDSAVFSMNFDDYSFTSFTGFWEVVGEGVDKVFDTIETLVFADQNVTFGDLAETNPGPAPVPVVDPDAQDDAFTVTAGADLSAGLFADNGSGVDSHSLAVSFDVIAVNGAGLGAITLSSGAVLDVSANGTVSFVTNGAYEALGAGDSATVTFSYTIESTDGGTDTATVSITVQGQNDGPTAQDDAFTVSEEVVLSGSLLTDNGAGADSDPDDADTLSIIAVNGGGLGTISLASGARLTVNADGTFSLNQAQAHATLTTGETATETFTYTLSDGQGSTDTATVTITIQGEEIVQVQTGTEDGDYLMGSHLSDTLDGAGGRDTVIGGSDSDSLLGGDANDSLWGQDGDDRMDGGGHNDRVYGNDGDDIVHGGDGTDRAYGGVGDDEVYGDNGNDRVYGDAGEDVLYGGEGIDQAHGGDGQDSLFGGEGRDRLNGGNDDDVLYGGVDRDQVDGGWGDDVLFGGDGRDNLLGRNGDDVLYGGEGRDLLSGSNGNDLIIGGEGDDRGYGGRGEDTIDGGAGDDRMWGHHDVDTLFGGEGEDRLDGGRGADFLYGGDGDDDLRGGHEDDVIEGGAGDDRLRGDRGADRFVFNLTDFGSDRLDRWEDGEDVLDFTGAGLGFSDFTITQDGRDTVLSYGDSALRLTRVDLSDIDSLDFA